MEAVAKYKKHVAITGATVVLIFSAYCLFYELGNEPFIDYDEATYAEVTHESIEQGSPSGLTYLHSPYFRKPPLLFWMTTASEHVFNDVEFADRFPSALAGLASILVVALVCIEAGAGIGAGIVAAGILATTAGWMEFARDIRFDNLVAFFCVAALYAAIRAARDARWFLMVGVALALAILSKNVMAVFGGVGALAVLICDGALVSSFRSKWLWYGAGVFFLIVSPWHLYMTLTYGSAFWHSYLGTEVFERARMNLFPGGSNPTNADYVVYLYQNAAPWFQLFILSILSTSMLLRRMNSQARSAFIASAATALCVLGVAFTAHTKAFGYLMPLFPFMAVAIALCGKELWRFLSANRYRILLGSSLFLLSVYLLISAAQRTRYEALHIDPYYGWEVGQATEERAIGQIIRAAPNPEVYTYNGYSDLGSIYYYSELPDTDQPYILLWSASSAPSTTNTAFILATTSLESLSNAFPHYRFKEDYAGRFVSLFSVTAAR